MIKLINILKELSISNPVPTYEGIWQKYVNGEYNNDLELKRDLKILGTVKMGNLYKVNVKINPYKKHKYYINSQSTLEKYDDSRTSIKKIKKILDILEIPYNSCIVYQGFKILGIGNCPIFVSIVCPYNGDFIMFSEIQISQNTYWRIFTKNTYLKLKDIDFNNNENRNKNKIPYPILKINMDVDNNQITVNQFKHDGYGYEDSNYIPSGESILKFTLTKEPYIQYYGDDDPHTLIGFNNVIGNIKITHNNEIFNIPINYKSEPYDEFYDLDDGRTNFDTHFREYFNKQINKINLKRNKSISTNLYSKIDIENILKLT